MNTDAVKLLQGRYCNSLTGYSRFLTREVAIGDVPMGGNNPIRIQSMTTTDTMDTGGTVEQSIRMIDAGCEYIRITAPSIKEAQNLAEIKRQLRQRGYTAPLVADIHFTPNAAEVAARIVEKVRVNPGNYADKKKFDQLDYTGIEYQAELDRIYQKFAPLVKICKEYGTAMRIGTNHGSLSDRIMSRYGDTPQGMVESAMEFMRMCEALNYYSLVVSMKSSNPQVMVQAYRLLVETMVAEGMNYPLHLGVTEAGDGEDGRIKSAVGIGALLEDGLGDTVRVSLTEEPEAEAPVAIALVKRYVERKAESEKQKAESEKQKAASGTQKAESLRPEISFNADEENLTPFAFNLLSSPYAYKKRETYEANTFIGGHMVPRVVVDLSQKNLKDPAILNDAGYLYSPLLDKYNMAEQSVDFVYLADELPSCCFKGKLNQQYNYKTWQQLANKTNCHPLFTLQEYTSGADRSSPLNLVRLKPADMDTEEFGLLPLDKSLVFVLETDALHGMADQRTFFFKLEELGLDVPVIVKRDYFFESGSGEVGKSGSREVGKSESGEVGKLGSWEVRKSESREVGKLESREVGKSESREVGKSGSQEVGKSGSQEVGKSESWEVGKLGSWEVGKSGSQEVGKSESREVGKSGSREVGKLESREVGKLESWEVRKSESREVGKSGSQDVGKFGSGIPVGEDLDANRDLQLYSATDLGALLVDGFGDGIWIDAPQVATKTITSTAFGILQATRSRISKTEYISCPSCGRTLFDLMETTQMIRSRTSHLKGLKIAIMGCIVNGPGEMADADYGYVGSGPGKVTLYRGKEAVKKNIVSANALEELIGLISEDGNWIAVE